MWIFFKYVKISLKEKPFKLIEAIAEKVAMVILEQFTKVEQVSVKVVKPNPPIKGHYHSVAVEIIRSRN